MILTDQEQIVIAEDFNFNELDDVERYSEAEMQNDRVNKLYLKCGSCHINIEDEKSFNVLWKLD